jgi:hypothetical protein
MYKPQAPHESVVCAEAADLLAAVDFPLGDVA